MLKSQSKNQNPRSTGKITGEAVKNGMVGKGIDANRIDTIRFGKTQPVGVVSCPATLGRTKLTECLEPHRRAVVLIKGPTK